MAVTDSRLKKGKLTLTSGADTFEAACQTTNVRITPGVTEGDNVEVLCGDVIAGGAKPDDKLNIEAIQDFTDPAGFVAFAWRNRGKTVDFSWQPPDDAATLWAGKSVVAAVEVGGAVGEQLRTSAEWKITDITPPTGFGDGSIGTRMAPLDAPVVSGKTAKTGD